MRIEKKRTYVKVLPWVLMFGFYLYALYAVLKSGYMYDDLINYTVDGWCINNDATIWNLTKKIFLNWFNENGRCFIFSCYAYFLFSTVNLKVYKLLIVLFTFLDGVILSQILYRISGRKKVKWYTLLIFPILISLDCSWFNAMFGFQMLVQLCLLWVFLGVLCFQYYLEKNEKKYQLLSCIFWFIALGTYEVAYPMCLLFVVVSFFKDKSIGKTIRRIIPQAVVGIFWLLVNVYARTHAISNYGGTSIAIGPECFSGFAKHLSGSSSIFHFLTLKELAGNHDIMEILRDNWFYYVGLVVLFVFGSVLISKIKEKVTMSKKTLPLILTGLIVMVVPGVLMAISERYQSEITWRHGYIPTYASCWGIVCLVAVLLGKIAGNHKRIGKVLQIILVTALSFVAVINAMVGDITVKDANAGMHGINEFVAEAVQTDLMDELTDDIYYIDGNGCWGEVDSHFAYLLKRKVKGVGWQKLYVENPDGTKEKTMLVDQINQEGYYYSIFSQKQYDVFGKCDSAVVEFSDSGAIRKSMYTTKFRVYVDDDYTANTLGFIDQTGVTAAIPLKDCKIVSQTKYGVTYEYTHSEHLDLNTVTVYQA